MFIVVAVVIVATVIMVRHNLEPPAGQQQASQQGMPAGSDTTGMSPEQMQQEMEHQIAHIKDVLATDSSNYEAWSALGNLYFDANMPKEAIVHYRRALELQPDHPNVMTDLATMLRVDGQSEEAVQILEQVVANDSNFTQAWFNLGVIYTFDLKEPAPAIRAWEHYIALDPMSDHAEAIKKELEQLKAQL